MKQKIFWALLALTILAGAALRYYGSEWGVPHDPYWRNHYQDEAFTLGLLFKMGPDNLNPHYFINPSFHYYTLLAVLKTASLVGYIKPFRLPVGTNPIGQPAEGVSPEDYARMFRTGRMVVFLESIILIFLVFLIGRNLYNRMVGLAGAALTAVLPSLVFQSHFLVTDAPAVFWFVLAFWFLTTRVDPRSMLRWSILCGMAIGIAVGTKYTNILLLPPFLYRIYQLRKGSGPFLRGFFNRYSLSAALAALFFFFFTTPYALLSLKEFLYGDAMGFGGLFGGRGLMFYNNYPTNILTPFTVATYQSLRLPLTVLGMLGLVNLLWKRRSSDVLLLCFIGPFYLLMIYHSSPHLRHALMVLPFLMLAAGVLVHDLSHMARTRIAKPLAMIALAAGFGYTLLFSLAVVGRMTRIDTRIECAEWVRANLPPTAKVALASYFPWNYTPPIEGYVRHDQIIVTDYNYDVLLAAKCDYVIISEYEYREFAYAKVSKYLARKFVNELFSNRDYEVLKVIKKDFSVFGMNFHPRYPNLDWNPVNPVIYVFHRRS